MQFQPSKRAVIWIIWTQFTATLTDRQALKNSGHWEEYIMIIMMTASDIQSVLLKNVILIIAQLIYQDFVNKTLDILIWYVFIIPRSFCWTRVKVSD